MTDEAKTTRMWHAAFTEIVDAGIVCEEAATALAVAHF